MREIKFKAWDNKRKVWNYTLFEFDADGVLGLTEPGVICQFTGLKDKNGKEIYQGDILKAAAGNSLYEVIWKHSGWFRKPINGNWTEQSLFVGYKYQSVVGNIYETPSPLTGG